MLSSVLSCFLAAGRTAPRRRKPCGHLSPKADPYQNTASPSRVPPTPQEHPRTKQPPQGMKSLPSLCNRLYGAVARCGVQQRFFQEANSPPQHFRAPNCSQFADTVVIALTLRCHFGDITSLACPLPIWGLRRTVGSEEEEEIAGRASPKFPGVIPWARGVPLRGPPASQEGLS